MDDKKVEIMSILETITYNGNLVPAFESRPEVIKDFPCITYYIGQNIPTYDIRGNILFQNTTVVIDIWGNDSDETGAILATLESSMKEGKYLLVFSTDVPEPSKERISHVTTRFNL